MAREHAGDRERAYPCHQREPSRCGHGVVDLTRVAVRWSTQTYQPIVPFLTAGAIYVLAVMCLLRVQRYMEHRIVERYGVL